MESKDLGTGPTGLPVKLEVVLGRVKNSGGRHSSVVSSAPTILRLQVQIPGTPSLLFQFVFF